MTPDVNLLVAAFREDHSHHAAAMHWLVHALGEAERGARFSLLPMVAAGFVRLATHPKVFPDPAPPARAWDFLDALLRSPGVEMLQLGPEWPAFGSLCRSRNLAGNDVPDAWIAAAVRATGEHLVTFDRDFSRLLDRSEHTLLKG